LLDTPHGQRTTIGGGVLCHAMNISNSAKSQISTAR
jgi:hypothetical protein